MLFVLSYVQKHWLLDCQKSQTHRWSSAIIHHTHYHNFTSKSMVFFLQMVMTKKFNCNYMLSKKSYYLVWFNGCKQLRSFCIATDSNWIRITRRVVADPIIWKQKMIYSPYIYIYICNRKGSDLEYRKQQWPIEGEQTTRNNWYAMLKLFRETQQLKMNFELFLDFLDIY